MTSSFSNSRVGNCPRLPPPPLVAYATIAINIPHVAQARVKMIFFGLSVHRCFRHDTDRFFFSNSAAVDSPASTTTFNVLHLAASCVQA